MCVVMLCVCADADVHDRVVRRFKKASVSQRLRRSTRDSVASGLDRRATESGRGTVVCGITLCLTLVSFITQQSSHCYPRLMVYHSRCLHPNPRLSFHPVA